MRILSLEEQDLCKRILEGNGDNNYLGNIIDHKLCGVCIAVTRQPSNVELLFTIQNAMPTQEESEMVIERVKEISVLILTTVNLIKMLEKEGYIMLLQRANQISNQTKFGGCVGNMPSISSHFADQSIAQLLIEYIEKEIFITEEFREFCKHGYLARDERRFRTQTRNATIAIGVALFAALSNFIFNTLNKVSDGTKIKQEQIDTLAIGLKNIQNKLDTLNTTTKRVVKVPEIHDKIKITVKNNQSKTNHTK